MSISCRLCQASTHFIFKKLQLKKYEVSYFKCEGCGCAQTEEPYWLEEAYSHFTFALDTGMVARTDIATSFILALALLKKFQTDDLCIDKGGGTGLLTRKLRDHGLNAFWSDKYAKNIFSLGFEAPSQLPKPPKLITAFEVFEHLASPKQELDELFQLQPEYFLFSTELYQEQDPSWWYFNDSGQHIHFYTQEALEKVGASYGYHLASDGRGWHLFSKEPQPKKLFKILKKMSPKTQILAKKRWTSRVMADFETMKSCYLDYS